RPVLRARLCGGLPRHAGRCGRRADAQGPRRDRRRSSVPGRASEHRHESEQPGDRIRHRYLRALAGRQRAGAGGPGRGRRADAAGDAALLSPAQRSRDSGRRYAGAGSRPGAERRRIAAGWHDPGGRVVALSRRNRRSRALCRQPVACPAGSARRESDRRRP
ncbi:hypothetical protein OY671_011265, partial [Metschnikowia pulcherrima]